MLRAMSVWFGSGLFLSGYVTAVFGLVTRVVVLSEDPSDRWAAYAGLWLLLLRVPGALAVVHEGATSVVGLV